MTLQNWLKESKILSVITIHQAEDAVPLARAMAAGGVRVLEITLRTPAALAAIERIAQQVPEVTVGAGTVIHPDQLRQARAAGAQFAVSPGLTAALLTAMREAPFPCVPGVASAAEIMQALDMGFDILKPFPVELLGGLQWLKAHQAVFPHVTFLPTGGITQETMKHYLALPSVIAVGGGWFAPPDLIGRKDWNGIIALARAAAGQ
jgi:2-dehydro-3-deoxyphosphogluconate aldolase/(4S)-4-hydroxy-2-oxoglutarate aldolase